MLNEEWVKSSRSNAGGDCIEARLDGGARVPVRDSQNRERHLLTIPALEWRALLADIDAV
ncbi:DUF397 domain-containing protein [Nocardiopsis sediminis]|uniref:DUF397 domain-containing protein n=1 Tax=Nocardiopsis sediminis TaxID=1778267 RepID=A0ABV8FPB2_9ACTN